MSKENPYLMSRVLNEVVNSMLVGDWDCYDTKEGRKYFIFGWNAYRRETGSIVEGNTEERKWTPNASSDKFMRAVVADRAKNNYLEKAEKRLKQVGIPDKKMALMILRQIQATPTVSEDDAEMMDLFSEEQMEAVFQWFDALLTPILESVDAKREIKPSGLDEERQKLYLRELSYKYSNMLKKLESLEPLPFEDNQLNEATRCWLYGFYRATIILSACALEERLKQATETMRFDNYSDLVEGSSKIGILTGPNIEMAKKVFYQRNRVEHEKTFIPNSQDAGDVLAWVRGLLTHFHDQSIS
jgi:hypothetical protein